MLLFPNEQFNRLKRILAKQHLVLCSYVIEEAKEVVARKFPNRAKDLDQFFHFLPFEMVYTPERFEPSDFPHMRDPYDLPILVAAIWDNVDVFITGDKDFTAIANELDKPEILTPAQFLEIYG
jgi:predicted nucleic acid-binding protein